jgi:hypothetical protein
MIELRISVYKIEEQARNGLYDNKNSLGLQSKRMTRTIEVPIRRVRNERAHRAGRPLAFHTRHGTAFFLHLVCRFSECDVHDEPRYQHQSEKRLGCLFDLISEHCEAT